ncbi:MAG: cation:proton antiporter subunit C [Verrucomicrobiota bacterium]
MNDLMHDYAVYTLCFLLITVGLYGVLMKANYVKKVIGMTIFQAAIILFFIVMAYKEGASVPVLDKELGQTNAEAYVNPLPHALMLTAIVVGVATVGVALALLVRIYDGFKTLDEDALHKEMRS